MVKFIEMDQTVSLFSQLEQNKGPVVLINEFDVKPEEADEFVKEWRSIQRTSNSNQALFLHNSIVE
jgi:hypothetical protein